MIISRITYPPYKIYSRIVSLVPSLTELLYDLGLEEEVSGSQNFVFIRQGGLKIKHE